MKSATTKSDSWWRRPVACALLVFGFLSCAAGPAFAEDKKKDPDEIGNRKVDKGINFYSIEKEIALGKQMAQEVERQAKIVDDPIIAEYVNRVGQNLVRNSDAKVPFTIKVIDSEEINAFALPGGFFFVNTGILLNADNEAEMAGVMAHEIAHVAARHGTRQASRGELINYGSLPLIFMGGWTGFAIRQGASLAIPMGFLKFNRGFESEADMLGLQYMYKAGYDPVAFVDFFEKVQSLEKRKPGTMAKVFSDHPPTGDRITKSQEVIQKYLKEKPEYVLNTSEFNDVKARAIAMHGRRAIDNSKDSGRPTLRRNPSGQVDSNGNEKAPSADQDDRPTLKRRDN
ncbi:MAG TPA: M48 family metallopeptidase [Bryobacteraceae bacterium]|jgi:predicted Zn-dependent protease|nr:M48 family metallopeptidase [Bryobacteraceae bacterium]